MALMTAAERLAHQPPAEDAAEVRRHGQATNLVKLPRFSRSRCMGRLGRERNKRYLV